MGLHQLIWACSAAQNKIPFLDCYNVALAKPVPPLLRCKFLHPALFIARQCIGLVLLGVGSTVDLETVLWEQTALLVMSPLGLLYWSAIRTHWMIRSGCKISPSLLSANMATVSHALEVKSL